MLLATAIFLQPVQLPSAKSVIVQLWCNLGSAPTVLVKVQERYPQAHEVLTPMRCAARLRVVGCSKTSDGKA